MSEIAPTRAAAQRFGTSDPDEFQLPMNGLFADMELGRGSMRLADDFQQCGSLVKLQIIRDWQRSLARLRHAAMQQFAQELCSGQPQMEPGERQALIRSTCESLRIELPADFAVVPAEP
jgi:hypothetical protein